MSKNEQSPLLNVLLERVNSWLNAPEINLRGRRFTNAGRSENPSDFITKEELDEFKKDILRQVDDVRSENT